MPIVKLPDGTLVQLPDSPDSPEPSRVPGFLKETGKTLLRGLGLAALGVGDAMSAGPLDPNTLKPIPNPLIEKGRKKLDEVLPPNEGIYWRMIEGAGGGLASAPKNLPAMVGGGTVGAGAAAATSEFLKDQDPKLRDTAAALAGVLTGGATGFALSPKPTTTAAERAQRDTAILSDIALDRIGPKVDIAQTANLAANAAERFLQNVRQQRTNVFEGVVQGESVRPFHLSMVAHGLRNLASRPGTRPEEAAALREMASSFRDANGQYLTDLGQISLALKSRRDNPPAPGAATSRTIPAGDMNNAFRIAQEAVSDVNPALRNANNLYRYMSRTQVNPLQEGAVGKIADRNPNNPAYPTPVSRLDAIIADQSPDSITQTMLQLQTGGANTQEIARALLQRKLAKGPLSPGKEVYGARGSDLEAQMDAAITGAGRDPNSVRAPLRAADTLAETLPPQAPMSEAVSVHPRGISLRGIFRPGGAGSEKATSTQNYKQQIAELMRTASPAEIERLQRLAMFDPQVRAALTAQAAMLPLVQKD